MIVLGNILAGWSRRGVGRDCFLACVYQEVVVPSEVRCEPALDVAEQCHFRKHQSRLTADWVSLDLLFAKGRGSKIV